MCARLRLLGDPVEINVRGYELSIRKSEAENILLKHKAFECRPA